MIHIFFFNNDLNFKIYILHHEIYRTETTADIRYDDIENHLVVLYVFVVCEVERRQFDGRVTFVGTLHRYLLEMRPPHGGEISCVTSL